LQAINYVFHEKNQEKYVFFPKGRMMDDLEYKIQELKKRIDHSGLSYDAIAHSTHGYSPEYILRILRSGIKNPGKRAINAIEESLNTLVKTKENLPERNTRGPILGRDIVIAILQYQDSEQWDSDVAKWRSLGVSCFEARLLAILMHMNKSIL